MDQEEALTELSRYRFTFKQLKDIHAGPESPTNPTSN